MANGKIFRNIFRVHGFRDSLKIAIKGIVYLFLYHRNMRIIFMLGAAAFLLGIYFNLNTFEITILCLTISLVFVAEMVNTAIEMIIDRLTDKYNTLVKLIKDIAAAIVLIVSINALVVGYFLFWKKAAGLFFKS